MAHRYKAKLTANAPLKFLSLVIAIILWFVVLGSRTVEVTKELNLEILTPPDLMVSKEIPDKIAFRLSGPKAFLRNILNRKDPPIRVNLSNAKPGIITYRFFGDNIQVPIGVKVLLVNPASIAIKLEPIKSKEVPVRLITTGSAASGYKITGMSLKRNTIRIKGPESKLLTISEIETTPINVSEFKASGEREVPVNYSHHEGVSTDGEAPVLHFEVLHDSGQYRIKAVRVKVLTNRKYEISPPEITLYVSCSSEDLKQILKTRITAVANLHDKGPGVHEPNLVVELPDTIRLIKMVPAKVKVTIH